MLYDLTDLRPGVVATIGTGGTPVYELAVLLPEGVPVVGHAVGRFLGQQGVLRTGEAPASSIDQMPVEAVELVASHLVEET